MKKLVLLMLITSIILLCIGCGNSGDSGKNTENGQIQGDRQNESSEAKDNNQKLSMEFLENAPVTDKGEFVYFTYDGVAYISEFIGSSEVVVIPDEIEGCPVVEISDAAFRNNEIVKAVKIGKNVKRIGEYSFINCTSLEYVLFSESVEVIGKSSFVNCASMVEILLNEGLKTIEDGALCRAKVATVIPQSVVEIGLNGLAQPVKVYSGSYAEEYIVDYAANYGAEFIYEVIE